MRTIMWNPQLDTQQLYSELKSTVDTDSAVETTRLAYLLGAVDAVRLLGYLTEVPEVELYHLVLRREARLAQPLSLLGSCHEKGELHR